LHKSVKLVTGLLAPSLKFDDLAWGTEKSLRLVVDMETIFVPATHPAHPARPPVARGRKGSSRAAITQATSRETSTSKFYFVAGLRLVGRKPTTNYLIGISDSIDRGRHPQVWRWLTWPAGHHGTFEWPKRPTCTGKPRNRFANHVFLSMGCGAAGMGRRTSHHKSPRIADCRAPAEDPATGPVHRSKTALYRRSRGTIEPHRLRMAV